MDSKTIKKIAIEMVGEIGLVNLSRSALCQRAGIPDGSFPLVMGCTFFELVAALRAEGIMSPHTRVNKSRVVAVLRRENILDTAVGIAATIGYQRVTRGEVARAAGVSRSLVTKYFCSMPMLRVEIMRQAVRHENLQVIAQGLANGDPIAVTASADVKGKAAGVLVGA